jgi:3-methyladenine DNA glycosylase AlkD
MMDISAVMKQLESSGTEQNRKVYSRHGVKGAMFGVSYAHLGAMVKKIKKDHELACALWKTGNHDARVLATMIADPAQLTMPLIEKWVGDLDNYVLTDALSKLAGQSAEARRWADQFGRSGDEFAGHFGWNLVAYQALTDQEATDDYFRGLIETIEKKIHKAKNRVRHAMNGALIAIGMRNPALGRLAIEAAKRIGPVEVDHGETGCKTPDAVAYIQKVAARNKALGAGKKVVRESAKPKAKAKSPKWARAARS